MSTFTLDIYKPETAYNTPTGGSSLLPLNSDWLKPDGVTRYGVNFAISDTSGFDFGTVLPDMTSVARAFWRYGDKLQDYARRDRSFKCTVYIQGDTPALMKWGAQQLQAAVAEATEYTVSSFNNNGLGASIGSFLYLKYQPDPTVTPVYFRIITGMVDLSKATEQAHLLQGFAEVGLDLRISYTGYGDAVWLQNLVPNGTFAYGFNGYTTSGGAVVYTGVIPTAPGPGAWNWWLDIPGYTGIRYNSHDSAETGMETAWSLTGGSNSDVWSAAVYNAGNQAGTDILYTPEYPLTSSTSPQGATQSLWLAFEYYDNDTLGNFCSAQLQVYDTASGGGWYSVGAAIVPANNTGSYTRYSWGAAIPIGANNNQPGGAQDWINATKFRVAFSMDRNRSYATAAHLRKIALWSFPNTLPAAMVKLPVEYVSQPVNLTQLCVVTGIQGNLETAARVKITNPPNCFTAGSATVYQQAYIGARKFQKSPYKYYYYYTTSPTSSIPIGTQQIAYSADTDNTQTGTHVKYGIPAADLRARQYRVLLRASTDQPCGLSLSTRYSQLPAEFTLVPNGTMAELPNTGGVIKTIDCGIVTLPSYRLQTNDDPTLSYYGSAIRRPDVVFTRTASTPSGSAVNISLNGIWFLPVDQYNVIDTRATAAPGDFYTISWHNYINTNTGIIATAALAAHELVVDMLSRDVPSIFLGNNLELDAVATPINPSANANGFMFYPSTTTSPEPMAFGCVIRRVGTSGAPNADVTNTDPLSFSFLYCPAYEF